MQSSGSPGHIAVPPVRGRAIARAVGRWWLALLAALMFGGLAAEVHRRGGAWFDEPVLAWLHDARSPALTEFMRSVTHLGDGIVLAVLAVVATLVLILTRHPYSALYVAASAAGAGALNHFMKIGFARARPDVLFRLSPTDGFAFPSGHGTGACAVYGALAIVVMTRFQKLRSPLVTICALIVGVIGISRAYLHVHHPSDVVAGWAVGLLWILVIKPLILGRGFRRKTIPGEELAADGVAADT